MNANGAGIDVECEAIPIAREALRIAQSTSDSVMDLHMEFGRVTGAMGRIETAFAELRTEVNRFQKRLGRTASSHDLEELADEVESQKVQKLNSQIAGLKKRQDLVVKWALGIIASIIIAAVCAHYGWQEP